MKLIKRNPKGNQKLSFRTPHGQFSAYTECGCIVLDVGHSRAARYFMIRHGFVPAPADFGKKEEPKPEPKPKAATAKSTKKPATKKAAPKKK
jgi:hypothetical protein